MAGVRALLALLVAVAALTTATATAAATGDPLVGNVTDSALWQSKIKAVHDAVGFLWAPHGPLQPCMDSVSTVQGGVQNATTDGLAVVVDKLLPAVLVSYASKMPPAKIADEVAGFANSTVGAYVLNSSLAVGLCHASAAAVAAASEGIGANKTNDALFKDVLRVDNGVFKKTLVAVVLMQVLSMALFVAAGIGFMSSDTHLAQSLCASFTAAHGAVPPSPSPSPSPIGEEDSDDDDSEPEEAGAAVAWRTRLGTQTLLDLAWDVTSKGQILSDYYHTNAAKKPKSSDKLLRVLCSQMA